jgi:hypothetical protein
MIANRPSAGMTSRNSSSRFPTTSVDWADRPVILPPGCDRLATYPVPTGSFASANTMGMTDVACFDAGTPPPVVTMISTFRVTNSAAISVNRSVRPSAQRLTTLTFWPSIQPSSRRRCTKAAVHWLSIEDAPVPSNPMVNSLPCCACAESGHATAAPPTNEMKVRRLVLPSSRGSHPTTSKRRVVQHSKFRQMGQNPTATRIPLRLLPPATDVPQQKLTTVECPTTRREQVRQTPQLFDHLVGNGEQSGRKGETELLCSFEIYHKLKRVRLHYRQVSGFGAL